jgi:hypothetical protein
MVVGIHSSSWWWPLRPRPQLPERPAGVQSLRKGRFLQISAPPSRILKSMNFCPLQKKKWTIPIVLPSGGATAARRRHRAKQHCGYIGREKSGLLRVSAYILPAASRDAARRAWGNPSGYLNCLIESLWASWFRVPLRQRAPADSHCDALWISERKICAVPVGCLPWPLGSQLKSINRQIFQLFS